MSDAIWWAAPRGYLDELRQACTGDRPRHRAVRVLAAATQYLDGEDESGLASCLVDTTQQVGSAVVALTRRRADQAATTGRTAGASR